MYITIEKLYLLIPTIIFFVSIISFFIGDTIRDHRRNNKSMFIYIITCSLFSCLIGSGIVIFFIEELLKNTLQ